LKEKKDKK